MDDNGENVGVPSRRYLREEVAPGQLAAVPHPRSNQESLRSGQDLRTFEEGIAQAGDPGLPVRRSW